MHPRFYVQKIIKIVFILVAVIFTITDYDAAYSKIEIEEKDTSIDKETTGGGREERDRIEIWNC